METYYKALAPGTYDNRARQARSYIKFAILYNVNYLSPTILNVCMYIQYLANQQTAIRSIKNYVAGAKTWVLEHRGYITAFLSTEVSNMYKSVSKDSQHVTKRALPLSWEDIQSVCSYLDSCALTPLCVKPCILIAYSTFLRGSNLLASPHFPWGGPHTLLVRNILETSSGLIVVINSTKSRTKPYSVTIPRLPQTRFCPVHAWSWYVRSDNPPSSGPAFVLHDRSPLTSNMVVTFMKAALGNDPSRDVSQITMHSLRRGAAQDADRSGVDNQKIMKRGGWSSTSGFKPYLLD